VRDCESVNVRMCVCAYASVCERESVCECVWECECERPTAVICKYEGVHNVVCKCVSEGVCVSAGGSESVRDPQQ